MQSLPISSLRALWVLLRVQLLRLANSLDSARQRLFKPKQPTAGQGRRATPGKAELGW